VNVAVVGTGYVGLVTGAGFAEFGVQVTCMDRDEAKIAQLQAGQMPFYEPGLRELVVKATRAGRLGFTSSLAEAVRGSLVVFIAVGTPPRGDGSADLRYVEDVARGVAAHLDEYKIIVTKSTVPVGTGARLRALIAAERRETVEFDVAANPEFLREGSALEDFFRPNRVVIGATSPQAIAILKDLYRPLYLIETPFVITDIETAELIKYASNAFLATKISFINEMARLCERVGADVHQVALGMGLDNRIGRKFLHPGPGFGGSCLPKDLAALRELARGHGLTLEIAEAVARVNAAQQAWALSKIAAGLGGLAGRTVGVLGLAYKPNTDDVREAPALSLVAGLLGGGASVRAYDPEAVAASARQVPAIAYGKDAYEAAEGCDAVALVTEWNEFRNLDLPRLRAGMKGDLLCDLRNVYEPAKARAAGFRYVGVGRA
jgi:UDPglucose 6-dehydrogenase